MKKRAFLLSSLYYPNVGGVENSLRELSRELIGRGYDVFLITSNRDLVNNKILPETDIIDGVSVIRCNYPLSGYGFFVFIKNLYLKIRELGVSDDDLIIARSHWPIISARLAGVRELNYVVPSVYLMQEKLDFNYFFSSKVARYLVNVLGQFLALLVSRVYVFSKDMQRQSRVASLGICKASILKPGVSKDRYFFVNKEEKNEIREDLGLSRDVSYLLCVGRFSEVKQFDIAIKSLKYLEDRYRLLLVGGGPELCSYKKVAESEGVVDRVCFVSFTDDVDKYYKAADFYLMTSRYESFGQVLLEATSCGLPVVAFSKSSGVRTSVSYIYEGFDKLLIECNEQSPVSLARAIDSFNSDKDIFNGEVSDFVECYSWSSTIDALIFNTSSHD